MPVTPETPTTFTVPPTGSASADSTLVTSGQSKPGHSCTLLTVNKAPEKAFEIVARLATVISPGYSIIHIGNIASIEDVFHAVDKYQPDLLFSARTWSADEVEQIQAAAKRARRNVITHAIPKDLQAASGSDSVVDHLVAVVPTLLDRT